MPASVKLQETYGDDLQVIFVECQNTPKDVWEAFVWKMKWMGNGAMWTIERPISTTGNGLPETALIGNDGSVLMQGHPGNMGKKLEEAIVAEIKKAKQAPAGTPKELEKAWASFNKGEIAAAIAECDKVASEASKSAKNDFIARTESKVKRAGWLIENGFITEADALVDKLDKAVKGSADLNPKVLEQKAKLAAPAVEKERDADKAWDLFVGDVAKKKPFEPGNAKRAEGLAKKHAGTNAAQRFDRFVALSKVELNK